MSRTRTNIAVMTQLWQRGDLRRPRAQRLLRDDARVAQPPTNNAVRHSVLHEMMAVMGVPFGVFTVGLRRAVRRFRRVELAAIAPRCPGGSVCIV